jgi:hypothetical protein
MSRAEQEQVQAAYYQEANRYLQNARETLQKAGKEGNFYQDEKYVKTACGTAYNGVLKAIDGYFLLKNVPAKKGRKNIEYYTEHAARLDKKLKVELKNAYDILHLAGHYDGVTSVATIQDGFAIAERIINRLAA